jgi:hypothetical protein
MALANPVKAQEKERAIFFCQPLWSLFLLTARPATSVESLTLAKATNICVLLVFIVVSALYVICKDQAPLFVFYATAYVTFLAVLRSKLVQDGPT